MICLSCGTEIAQLANPFLALKSPACCKIIQQLDYRLKLFGIPIEQYEKRLLVLTKTKNGFHLMVRYFNTGTQVQIHFEDIIVNTNNEVLGYTIRL